MCIFCSKAPNLIIPRVMGSVTHALPRLPRQIRPNQMHRDMNHGSFLGNPKADRSEAEGFWGGSFLLFIRPCCHDEDRQAARMKAPKHGISDESQWPVRYSNSAPITLIARTNVAYGSDATLKKCDINCVIITQLIISSRRQRDQAVRIPSEMGSEPKNCQLGNRHRPEIRLSAHNP